MADRIPVSRREANPLEVPLSKNWQDVYRGYGIQPRWRGQGSIRRYFDQPEPHQRVMGTMRQALADPFKGITTDGNVVPNLFPISHTGISTKPIKNAADALLAALSDEAAKLLYPVDAPEWRLWTNAIAIWEMPGISLELMNPVQREAALAVLRASLSSGGFDTARKIMTVNQVLADMTGDTEGLGEWKYHFSLFGVPSMDEPWGWQLQGHHLIINFFILGDQVVISPAFMGAEPSHVDHGPHAGLHVFEEEERGGLALINALSSSQRSQAVLYRSMLSADLPPPRRHPQDGRHVGGAFQDNRIVPYEGISCESLTLGQRNALRHLLKVHLGRLRPGHAEIHEADVWKHLQETRFAWIGGSEPGDAFYYKIQSPVILIEFDHHKGVFLDNEEPENFHPHVVMRTPNGNDYGRDLLRQHYELYHRPAAKI